MFFRVGSKNNYGTKVAWSSFFLGDELIIFFFFFVLDSCTYIGTYLELFGTDVGTIWLDVFGTDVGTVWLFLDWMLLVSKSLV